MNAVEEKNPTLPRNVKLLGWASLLNDVASEMVYPLLPQFLIQVLGGNKLYLGLIEGAADTAASLLKLGSGGWSDRLGARKGFVVFGYALAGLVRPLASIAVWRTAGSTLPSVWQRFRPACCSVRCISDTACWPPLVVARRSRRRRPVSC